MFEKDIYQLIRGLRAHKGNEREYIQSSLRECRKEVKSQDMDQKATALLKLVYLEMFGHDMSWASFNVLEVMSSPKYLQKRVGYLAAVQSFRPDTEVLMLAENLLKKDLNSPDKLLIGLPLAAVPHVVNPSMANSLLTDLLPRLSHSMPAIRKKTIVTLYRLALVYPETLRPAWPKIKERLLDEDEDPSVTAAIVNVVCELGWRRPHDFLPLAPRLFELLTDSGNNWMAIKIIKLFSVLIPLEPRLVKKLLPPLTTIIKTTPAMSLLYECINGIIQGGVMEAVEGTVEGDEIARLCVNKLRAMLVVQGDPNLRYVALLAFAKITSSHADLVAQHQDVILECIDDPDISIRTRALDLVVGMVNANNLQAVVERLLTQLRASGRPSAAESPENDRAMHDGVIPMADEDEDEARITIGSKKERSVQAPPLPDVYRSSVIERTLEMCSSNTYANMNDFEWYIGVLIELVKQCPSSAADKFGSNPRIADSIGYELLNVAVRVKAVRPEAAAAAQSLLLIDQRERLFPSGSNNGQGVLSAAAFVAGEYASMLPDAEATLTSLLHTSSAMLPTEVLKSYLQAVPKLFAALTSNQQVYWTPARRNQVELLAARIIHFLEPLTLHPNLEVQERAVEYLDLMRLASEATTGQVDSNDDGYAEPPLLLTQAIPALFSGMELNPVALTAIRKVPQPEYLDLDTPINSNLQMLLSQAEYDTDFEDDNDEVYKFYHEKPAAAVVGVPDSHQRPAAELLDSTGKPSRTPSYQSAADEDDDRETLLRKKAERRERYKDDPYYIDPDRNSGTSTPMHQILKTANAGDELDVDAIPVMELNLDLRDTAQRALPASASAPQQQQQAARKKPKKRFEIAADETLDGDDHHHESLNAMSSALGAGGRSSNSKQKSLLEVDSSALSSLSLTAGEARGFGHAAAASSADRARRAAEDEEMASAMREVERLRLEMQRAQERVGAQLGVPEEGTLVRRKGGRRKVEVRFQGEGEGEEEGGEGGEEGGEGVKKKKRKKKKSREGEQGDGPDEGNDGERRAEPEPKPAVKAKRKKKRQVAFDGDGDDDPSPSAAATATTTTTNTTTTAES